MKNNKLIAEFMGMNYGDPNDNSVMTQITPQGNEVAPIDSMKYHTSWDWLIPVVEKIESFQDGNDGDSMRGHLYNFRIEQNFVYILDGESMDVIIEMNGDNKRDATYKAVVEFIKQHNQNK